MDSFSEIRWKIIVKKGYFRFIGQTLNMNCDVFLVQHLHLVGFSESFLFNTCLALMIFFYQK